MPTKALRCSGLASLSISLVEKGALKSQNWGLPENCSTLAVNTVVTAPSLSTNSDTAVCSVICITTYPLVILIACIF